MEKEKTNTFLLNKLGELVSEQQERSGREEEDGWNNDRI